MSRPADPDENIGANTLTASVPLGGVWMDRPWEWRRGFVYVVKVGAPPPFAAWTPVMSARSSDD